MNQMLFMLYFDKQDTESLRKYCKIYRFMLLRNVKLRNLQCTALAYENNHAFLRNAPLSTA